MAKSIELQGTEYMEPVSQEQSKTGLTCHYCQLKIDGNIFYKGLLITKDDLLKVVICVVCVSQKEQEVQCYWKKVVPPKSKRALSDMKKIFSLFQKLIEVDQASVQIKTYIYLLSLFLFRKKKLKLVERSEVEGKKYIKFQTPYAEKTIQVEEVKIPQEQIEQMTVEFMKFLEETE